ncbi:two component transcriptional regulator, winged helix family [Streptomyces laurentii]|uniref:Two component transcriptional regulator, winged helix family n=1 Tax=Streptomyces laurentii TaxID=39478 RepID=A0A160NV42_STRLU|nr:two component transcriptional regulator, winged helix family [Streptomyces laurentii]
MVPMPPRMTAARRNAEFGATGPAKTYISGTTVPWKWAWTVPATPARVAPRAKAMSLTRKPLMPMAVAAVSSSRMATQARPMRESWARLKTTTTRTRTSSISR